jgi:hypothetical protein
MSCLPRFNRAEGQTIDDADLIFTSSDFLFVSILDLNIKCKPTLQELGEAVAEQAGITPESIVRDWAQRRKCWDMSNPAAHQTMRQPCAWSDVFQDTERNN